LQVGDVKRLIQIKKEEDDPILYYIPYDEYYEIISKAHVDVGHGGINKTDKELSKKIGNICIDSIRLFINSCEQCQSKRKKHGTKG
jgi:hypothetical protein